MPRPSRMRDQAARVLNALFPPDQQDWLYTTDKDGNQIKGQYLEDLEAFASAVEFGSSEHRIVHYCWVEAGSEEHLSGMSIGDPCCESFEEALEKTAVPCLNWLCHATWEQACESRWTKVVTTLRRAMAGYLGQQVLPECLKLLQTTWGINEGMEAALARIVASDASEFTSKNKLRLLRACRVLCQPAAAEEMAIVFQSLLCVDALLFEIMGDGVKVKATLADLCSDSSSPIAKVQDNIVCQLEGWGEHTKQWEMFHCVGGSPQEHRSILQAKASLLQLAAACLGHFELRMNTVCEQGCGGCGCGAWYIADIYLWHFV